MQCPYYIHTRARRPVQPAGRAHPRRADGDRRRLRRQGRVPVHDRRPRRAARVEVGQAGEDDLRPQRRHGGDDQAPPVADAPSHGGRRATAACSRWTSTSRSTAARTARCRPSSCRAARFTPPDRMPVPTCAFAGRAVATNVPPHGAFRGFGAPQSIFALERHMDKVAAAVGLAPEEFRRRNFIRPGDTLAVGQTIEEPVDMAGAARSRVHRSPSYRVKAGAVRAREPGTPASRRGSASRPSCTAPASPDRARCTCSRWSTVEGDARRHGARAGREHGDRPGDQHHLFADRRRGARDRVRRRRHRPARYVGRARQRADRRVAHVHGRGQARRVGGARREARVDRRRLSRGIVLAKPSSSPPASGTCNAFGAVRATSQYQAAARPDVGRREVSSATRTAPTRGRCTSPRCRST